MGTPRTTLRPNTLTDTNTTPTMRRRATLAAAHYLRTDATEVLMKDHQKVQGMLRTVISSGDNKVRKENMNQVVYELSQHSAVEEQVRDLSVRLALITKIRCGRSSTRPSDTSMTMGTRWPTA